MRVLFVENHHEFAATVIPAFLAAHDVIVVPSIAEAQRAIADARFDVALVDYDLDDGKGEVLVRWLRREVPGLPIIATSARDDGNDALIRAGADAICAKRGFAAITATIAAVCAR